VRWLVIHRDEAGKLDGFLCLSPAFNAQPFVRWDIDYVFVREGCRGRGIGMAIMIGAINAAMTPPSLKKTNTVELFFRSRASLRPFYTKAGFQVYAEEE
jgi:GNAT superfamily N-acetyltransferase